MLEAQSTAASPTGVVNAASDSAVRETHAAHLLAQIAFLHREVERLEGQLSTFRAKSVLDARKLSKQYEDALEQKTAEIEELRQKAVLQGGANDLLRRCKLLEKQLATVNAEKSVASMEKNDMCAKVRKLELLLRARKQDFAAAQRSAEDINAERSSALIALKMATETLTIEKDVLQRQLTELKEKANVAHIDKGLITDFPVCAAATQTDAAERVAQACQVSTLPSGGDGVAFGDVSAYSLRTLLEEKTRECDDLRSRLDDLVAVQRDSLAMLDAIKNRLADEVECRRLAVSDAENLSVQVRGLQQRCSDQVAAERSLSEKLTALEDERQRILVEKTQMERERHSWEEQLHQFEKDLSQLSATKNHTNQQLSSLANEKESLQAELQSFSERDAQMAYSLKAKDMETQEILFAYQKSAQENESLLENQRFLERELDNARATLAAKEEGAMFLQEQLRSLHMREQQLTLDLQSFEYENESLHQRLARGDAEVAALENNCSELQQLLNSKDQSIEELHQSLRELSKQVVCKDNETLLLRQRCDELLGEITHLRAALSAERTRVQELEDANARLIAREVLSRDERQLHEGEARRQRDAHEALMEANAEKRSLTEANERLHLANEELETRMASTEQSLKGAIESKDRLHKIVLEQNKALSRLFE